MRRDSIDSDELERELQRLRRTRTLVWTALLTAIAAVGLSVMFLVSFDIGFVLLPVLAFGAVPVQLRIDRAMWRRRFPPLRDEAVQ